MAGAVHSKADLGENQKYGLRIGEESQENIYAPFVSQLDWEVARWAKFRGPSSNSFTELMAIDGVNERLGLLFKNTQELNKVIDTHLPSAVVNHDIPGRPPFQRKEILVGNEVCKLYFQDIIQCIHALFSDPDFAPYLIFAPERHYTDEDQEEMVYHDMYTGQWWWFTQVAIEKDVPGATIVPVLISTDKTQLTPFRNKCAYPIYMTIGNIPKEIRRKTSMRAYVLLGYLPTTKLKQEKNQAKQKRLIANLYHTCLRHILEPLVTAGNDGVFMSTASGDIHHVHPILASFIGDYPEQVLTTCMLTGDCPRCGTTTNNLGNFDPDDVPAPRSLGEFVNVLGSFCRDPAGFLQASSRICAKPVPHPFWLDLPWFNVFHSITPDVLHQLYQGIIKYLKAWILSACEPSEIDTQCRFLPPNHNICLFTKGISSLSQVTGQEHDQMCCFLLGLIIDIRLPNNMSNIRFVQSAHALLDYLYLAQYPIHSNSTLHLLMDALTSLYYFGTTDNFNTQFTKRLHIELIKKAYEATNHKDEYEQMASWVDRKECMHRHEQYIQWLQADACGPTRVDREPPSLDMHWELSMTKHPSVTAVPLDRLEDLYGAPLFKVALRRFISTTNRERQGIRLPFTRLPVWHVIKFTRFDALTGTRPTADSIHVKPARCNKHKRPIPGRFDTALINDGTGTENGIKGYFVGHVRIVFSIPTKYHDQMFKPEVTVPLHLAYVQWYSKLTEPEPNRGMFKICPLTDAEGNWICSIVPVGNIRRSVHLIPKFGPVAPAEWTSSNVLDRCKIFYLNAFSDRQIFRMTT
ncbi:hypothetical protein V8E53_002294 [Lactarius tabidus]